MTVKTPDWQEVARTVLLSREMDRLEEQQLAPQGKVKYQFSAGGHELAQILLAQALDHPKDAAATYYRSRPFALANGLTALEALTTGMARSGSISHGRDAGVVFNMPRRNRATILPATGDVGAQYTPAVGWAQAIVYRQRVLGESEWDRALVIAMGGDGSVASNGFWSALNIATTLQLPILFSIEDNQYGISVPASLQTPDGDIAANLKSYGNLKTIKGDGTDPQDAWEAIQSAVDHVRAGQGPALLKLSVVRLRGHTFIDNQAYKSEETLAAEAKRDPLGRLRSFLAEQEILSQDAWEELASAVRAELDAALSEAESAPEPDPTQAADHIFYEGLTPLQGGLRPERANIPLGSSMPKPAGPRINLIDAVRQTMHYELSVNPRLMIFGEDVGVKGGVHGATRDLQLEFGPDRVFDTSLSEEGIIGRATGLALAGLLPMPEIQFRKYADPAHDQITNLGWLRWRTAGRFAAPTVVRIPVGFSNKTGDPWHSVTGEAVFAHTPGWRIAFPSNAEDAVGLLRTALREGDPTFFFEHRALLDSSVSRRSYPGDDYCLPFGVAAQLTQGDELTLVAWGAMVSRSLEAVKGLEDRVAVIDLRTIVPWDQEAVLESVRKTGKVLLVQEDTITVGFASEIAATISEQAFTWLDAPIARLSTPDVPVPYNIGMMNALIPGVPQIREKIETLLAF